MVPMSIPFGKIVDFPPVTMVSPTTNGASLGIWISCAVLGSFPSHFKKPKCSVFFNFALI